MTERIQSTRKVTPIVGLHQKHGKLLSEKYHLFAASSSSPGLLSPSRVAVNRSKAEMFGVPQHCDKNGRQLDCRKGEMVVLVLNALTFKSVALVLLSFFNPVMRGNP